MTNGGATRLKQHLAGGYGDVLVCIKIDKELMKQMQNRLHKNKKKNGQYSWEMKKGGNVEVLLDQNVTTSFSMPVVPSSGITAKRRRATYDFRAPIVKKKSQAKGDQDNYCYG